MNVVWERVKAGLCERVGDVLGIGCARRCRNVLMGRVRSLPIRHEFL